MMQQDYATVKEFAEMAGVTTQTIYKRMQTDLSEYVKMDGNRKTVNLEALSLFITHEPQPLQAVENNLYEEQIEFLKIQLNDQMDEKADLHRCIKELNDRLKESNQLAISLQQDNQGLSNALQETKQLEEQKMALLEEQETTKKWWQFWK